MEKKRLWHQVWLVFIPGSRKRVEYLKNIMFFMNVGRMYICNPEKYHYMQI